MTRFLSDKSNTRCDVAASEEDATEEVLKHAVDVLFGDKSRIWNPAESGMLHTFVNHNNSC